MTELFLAVFNMSIAASFVALVVLIIRLLLKRAPKGFSYILWLAVAMRLAIPMSPTSDFSLLKLLKPESKSDMDFMSFTLEASSLMKAPILDSGIRKISNVLSSTFPGASSSNLINPLQTLLSISTVVWLAGIAVFLVYSIAVYLRMQKRIRTATLVADSIYETDQVDTPFVYGFIRPRIIVPTGLNAQELSYVVMHEQVHIQRKDYWIKPFAYLLLVMHWFNPLMWLCYIQMSRDMEMSCDERVVSRLGNNSKGGYATTLLSLSSNHKPLPGHPLAFGEHHVKARIRNVLAYRKLSGWATACLLAVITIMIAGCVTNPKPIGGLPQQAYHGYDLNTLLENKTLYVGNHIKVGGLIGGMPRPDGLDSKGMELQTSSEPYGVTYRYLATDTYSATVANNTIFYHNAVLLMSLIDNVGSVTYAISENSEQPISITFTREQINESLGEDVRTYAVDEEGLKELIGRLVE